MSEIFIGRQPIYDREMHVQAYELLFRAGDEDTARFVDGEAATSALIQTLFVDIGLERLVGNKPAFLNLTRSFFTDGTAFSLPKDRVVLEVLEDILFDEEVIRCVRALIEQGYRLALDDYVYHAHHAEVLDLVQIVKIDLTGITPEQLGAQVELLRKHNVELLAEKVETEAQYRACQDLGFDYFQGYYLSRPVVVQGQALSASRLAVLQLLNRVYALDVDLKELETHIASDVALSHRLLRFINSAFYGLPRPIETLHQGLVYLGLDAIRNWVAVMTLRDLEDGRSDLLHIALVRARMAQRLAEASDLGPGDRFFTAGLFSVLERSLHLPMERVLQDIPLSAEIKAALLSGQGPIGEALACTLAFESESASECRQFHGLDEARTGLLYLEAVTWAHETAAATS